MTALLFLVLVVLLPLGIALGFQSSSLQRAATSRPAFHIGTPIVYREDAVSTCPASDAHDVYPAERGDYYYYSILNYLRVIEILGDGRIIAIARNHQRLCFWPNDSSLRKAKLSERVLYPLRFPRS